ncbi:type VII secretion protein EccB [Pseudonocardia sp. ICBG1122]|nr:type VII secretion protein EccB [Pseudonocardia pini]
MQSRRDQVQAYFYVVGRLAAAVTHGRPDALVSPHRRTATGTALGLLLAVLISAAFGIYGLFVPGGNNAWRVPGSIVLDADTGARYLYLDDQLRPVLNYSSARLATDASSPLVSVSSASLTGVPVGQPIGIPGAPDAVPNADRLDTGPWTVCVGPVAAGSGAGPPVALLLGRPAGSPLPDDRSLYVATPDGSRYLVWRGTRYRLGEAATATVLGYDRSAPIPVTAAWLNPIPAGRDLRVPATPQAGQPGPAVGAVPTRIGQVLVDRAEALGGDRFYLVRADGLAALSLTSAAMALASPSTAAAYPGSVPSPTPVDSGAVSRMPVSRGADLVDGLPAQPPQAVQPADGSVPCVRYVPSATGPPTAVPEVRSAAEAFTGTVPLAEHGAGTAADLVGIPTGTAALVQSSPAAAVGLVTDNGTLFPLLGNDVMDHFGYAPTSVLPVSQALIDLLPQGPPLSTAAALRTGSP